MRRFFVLAYGVAAAAAGGFAVYDFLHGDLVAALLMAVLGCTFAWVSGRSAR